MGTRLTYVSAMLIGVVSVLLGYSVYLVTGAGSLWGITTGESKLGGLFWQSLGFRADQLAYFKQFKLAPPLEDPTQAIVFAILVGGGAASLITRSFVVKHLPDRWMLVQAIVGGFLLGYGARLALGCKHRQLSQRLGSRRGKRRHIHNRASPRNIRRPQDN
jgi:hypothetical protein